MDFLKGHTRRRSFAALGVISGPRQSSDIVVRNVGHPEPADVFEADEKEEKRAKKDGKKKRLTKDKGGIVPDALFSLPRRKSSAPADRPVDVDGNTDVLPAPDLPTFKNIPPTPTAQSTFVQGPVNEHSFGRTSSSSVRRTLGGALFGRSTDSLVRSMSQNDRHNDFTSQNLSAEHDQRPLSPNKSLKVNPVTLVRSVSALFGGKNGHTASASMSSTSGLGAVAEAGRRGSEAEHAASAAPSEAGKSKSKLSRDDPSNYVHDNDGQTLGHKHYTTGAGIGYSPPGSKTTTLFSSLVFSSRRSSRTRTISTNTMYTTHTAHTAHTHRTKSRGASSDHERLPKSVDGHQPDLGWARGGASDSEEGDEEDDIRRPSGLGRSASFCSQRSMPFTEPEVEEIPEAPVRSGKPVAPAAIREALLRVFGGKDHYLNEERVQDSKLSSKTNLVDNATVGETLQRTASPEQEPLSSIDSPIAGYDRSKSASTPNLIRSLSQRLRPKRSISALGRSKSKSKRSNTAEQLQLRISTGDRGLAERPPTPPAKFRWPLDVPIEVLENILSFVPKAKCAQFARISREFAPAARNVLYSRLVINQSAGAGKEEAKMKPEIFEKLARLLAARQDLTDLVKTFICEEWPIGNAHRWKGQLCYVRGGDDDEQEALQSAGRDPAWDWEWNEDRLMALASTFKRAFQRMHRLTVVVLPRFEVQLLKHHTSFGLVDLTFMDDYMGGDRANQEQKLQEFLSWLDGQINIKALRMPRWMDSVTKDGIQTLQIPFLAPSPFTTPRNATYEIPPPVPPLPPQPKELPAIDPSLISGPPPPSTPPTPPLESATRTSTSVPTSPIYSLFPTTNSLPPAAASGTSSRDTTYIKPRDSSAQSPVNNAAPSQPTATTIIPTEHSFQSFGAMTSSSTLLPSLEILQGPPSFVSTLTTVIRDPFTDKETRRPLKNVIVNVNGTLYTGVRPATLISILQPISLAALAVGKEPLGEPHGENRGMRSLGFKFGEAVDRRTVEKVLSSAGGAFGGIKGSDEDDTQSMEGDHKEKAGIDELFLEMTAPALTDTDDTFEENLYGIVQSVLPRYHGLKSLSLGLVRLEAKAPTRAPSRKNTLQSLSQFPSLTSASSTSLTSHGHSFKQSQYQFHSQSQNDLLSVTSPTSTSFHADSPSSSQAHLQLPPSPLDLSRFPIPPSGISPPPVLMSPISVVGSRLRRGKGRARQRTVDEAMLRDISRGRDSESLSERDKTHLVDWLRLCPSLRRVAFLDRAVWGKDE